MTRIFTHWYFKFTCVWSYVCPNYTISRYIHSCAHYFMLFCAFAVRTVNTIHIIHISYMYTCNLFVHSYVSMYIYLHIKYVWDKYRLQKSADKTFVYSCSAEVFAFCSMLIESGYHTNAPHVCNFLCTHVRHIYVLYI